MKTSTKILTGAAVSAGVVIAAVKLNKFLKMEPFGEPIPANNSRERAVLLCEMPADMKKIVKARGMRGKNNAYVLELTFQDGSVMQK